MSKFKVGDTVRITKRNSTFVGQQFKVVHVEGDICVGLVKYGCEGYKRSGGFVTGELELVTPAPTHLDTYLAFIEECKKEYAEADKPKSSEVWIRVFSDGSRSHPYPTKIQAEGITHPAIISTLQLNITDKC